MNAPMRPPPPGQSEAAVRQALTAKKLVNLSTILGWGGLGVFVILGPVLAITMHAGLLGGVLSLIGAVAAIAGAIVGQIGRAMQGRVI